MKKIIGLILVAVLALGLATMAIAATPASGDISAIADIPTTITLDGNESVTYTFVSGSEALRDCVGKNFTLTSSGKAATIAHGFESAQLAMMNGFTGTVSGPDNAMNSYVLTITNLGSSTAEFTLTVAGPEGSMGNPKALDDWNPNFAIFNWLEDLECDGLYYFSYTNEDTVPVLVTLSDVFVGDCDCYSYQGYPCECDPCECGLYGGYGGCACGGTECDPITECAITMTSGGEEESLGAGEEVSIVVGAGDTALIQVGVDYNFCANYTEVAFLATISNENIPGTESNPLEISDMGEYNVPTNRGDEVYYVLNSRLAGKEITVTGASYIKIGETKIDADEGVVTAILDGETATIPVVVANGGEAAVISIDYAPIAINAVGDFTADVPAGGATEYEINSRLAGAVLTVEGEDAYIIMGETKVEAVDGVVSVVLDGEGATISVSIGNDGDAAAAFNANIDYAPIAINAVGDFTANVSAKGENKYEVNSKLAGAILTVKGENAYIIIGETKVVAVDGVVSVVLDGEGATIPVVIGNSGDKAAAFEANIAYGPTEINAVGDYDVTIAPKGEAAFVVNSKLHGAVITVKGEGAYLIIDGGEKIVAKDGVVSAKLEAKGATISVIVGNDGTEAGVWVVNVAAATTPETGDFGVIAAGIAIALSAIGGTAVVAKKKEN